MIHIRSITFNTLLIAVNLLFTLAAPQTVLAATTCPPLASKVVTATDPISTTSQDFANVAGTSIKFTQGGSKASCVLVSFSAEAGALTANNTLDVQALLDGATACSPGQTVFSISNTTINGTAARAMNFICASVAPGKHSIKMRYLSESGGSVAIGNRTMTVQYVP